MARRLNPNNWSYTVLRKETTLLRGNMLPQSARATNVNRFVLQEACKLPAHTGAVRWRSDSTLIRLLRLQRSAHNARNTFATTSYDYRPVDMKPNHPYIPLATLFSALFISTRFRHNRPYYSDSDDGTSTNIIP